MGAERVAHRLARRLRVALGTASLDETRAQLLEARHQVHLLQLAVDDLRDQVLVARHESIAQQTHLAEALEAITTHLGRAEITAARAERTADETLQTLRTTSRTAAAVAELVDAGALSGPDSGLGLVSVIMPVRNRADVVGDAIDSVRFQRYRDWELIIIDDGSSDGTLEILDSAAEADPRIVVRRTGGGVRRGAGASAARNLGLAESAGVVVAYLDSDNRFTSGYLSRIAEAFDTDEELQATVAQQLVVDDRTRTWWLRDDDRLASDLAHQNTVDLNAFAHRSSLLDRVGTFDESLRRLGDWDLIRRVSAVVPIRRLATLGSIYRSGRTDQISSTEPLGWNRHLLERKRPRHDAEGLRILAVEWHYPQLTESYVQADIDGLVALGAHVEVATTDPGTAAPYPTDQAVHRDGVLAAVAAADPDVVLVHWLGIGDTVAEELHEAGCTVPVVVRVHGYEHSADGVRSLLARPNVAAVELPAHLYASLGTTDHRLLVRPAAFQSDLFTPADPLEVERDLVVRAGVALPTKDYRLFFDVARRCADHRFVLCLAPAHNREELLDEIVALRDELDAPVEIRRSVPRHEMAELMRRAGIYLHTHTGEQPFGMPVSIAEALASSTVVLGPHHGGVDDTLGPFCMRYGDAADAARQVLEVTAWDDATWDAHVARGIDAAFGRRAAEVVAASMVDDWRRLGIIPRP